MMKRGGETCPVDICSGAQEHFRLFGRFGETERSFSEVIFLVWICAAAEQLPHSLRFVFRKERRIHSVHSSFHSSAFHFVSADWKAGFMPTELSSVSVLFLRMREDGVFKKNPLVVKF